MPLLPRTFLWKKKVPLASTLFSQNQLLDDAPVALAGIQAEAAAEAAVAVVVLLLSVPVVFDVVFVVAFVVVVASFCRGGFITGDGDGDSDGEGEGEEGCDTDWDADGEDKLDSVD